MKRVFGYLLVALLLAVLVATGVQLRRVRQQQLAAVPTPEAPAWALGVATVRRARATSGFPSLALVKGDREVSVSSRIAGIVLEMGPREGESVVSGAPLARIDTRELEQSLAALEARQAAAVADAERRDSDAARSAKLRVEHSISESRADAAAAAARAARRHARSLT